MESMKEKWVLYEYEYGSVYRPDVREVTSGKRGQTGEVKRGVIISVFGSGVYTGCLIFLSLWRRRTIQEESH